MTGAPNPRWFHRPCAPMLMTAATGNTQFAGSRRALRTRRALSTRGSAFQESTTSDTICPNAAPDIDEACQTTARKPTIQKRMLSRLTQ